MNAHQVRVDVPVAQIIDIVTEKMQPKDKHPHGEDLIRDGFILLAQQQELKKKAQKNSDCKDSTHAASGLLFDEAIQEFTHLLFLFLEPTTH